jgi:hypothetical protein
VPEPVKRILPTAIALAITGLLYAAIAWLASGIEIPPGVPTAALPWIRPLRVVATLGFALASLLRVPHLVGNLGAAILLGAVLGAVYATSRHVARLGR